MLDRHNRVYLEVNFGTGRGRLFYNYSCEADGVKCYDALSLQATSSVKNYQSGVAVGYAIGNSVVEAQFDECTANGLNCTIYEVARKFKISGGFTILSNGWGVCVMGHHSRYPSTEIYFDDENGKTSTIRKYTQLPGAVLALGVPDSHFGCETADVPSPGPPPVGGPGGLA